MIRGYAPIFVAINFASSKDEAVPLGHIFTPIRVIASLNSFLSSAFSMAGSLAPISSTPYSSKTPFLERSTAMLRAVCPPIVGSKASGRSLAITFSTNNGVNGSIYVRSAVSGSVIIVAGLEFTNTTS